MSYLRSFIVNTFLFPNRGRSWIQVVMICSIMFFFIQTILTLLLSLSKHNNNPEDVVKRQLVNDDSGRMDVLNTDQLLRLARSKSEGRFLERDAEAAKNMFMRAKELSTSSDVRGEALLGLGELAEQEGDAESAILYYIEGVGEGFEECVLRIGRLYHYGLHPFYLPDKLEAGRYYKYFQDVSDTLTPWVNTALREVMRTSYGDLDDVRISDGREYKTLPGDICMRTMRAWENKRSAGKRMNALPVSTEYTAQEDLVDFDEAMMNIYMELQHSSPKTRNDAQNAHDTAVTNSARHMLWTGDSKNAESDFDACVAEFLNTPDVDVDENAMKVLKTFSSNLHSKFDRSEKDAFVMVWRQLAKLPSGDRRRDAARALASNLSSGVENGFVVCSTGKIERALSTLDILAIEEKGEALIRPEWVIREEIGRTISDAFARELDNSDEETKDAYIKLEPTESEKKLMENVQNAVRKNVEERCTTDYVNSGLYDESTINALIEEYIQYV